MDSDSQTSNHAPLDRSSLQVSVLAAVTLVCLIVCLWLAAPFFTAIVWSLALGVAAYPIHRWISGRIADSTWAAIFTVAVIVLLILAPIFFIAQQVLAEFAVESRRFQAWLASTDLESVLSQSPYTSVIYEWLKQHMDFKKEASNLQTNIGGTFAQWLSATIWTVTQFLVMIFMLFYLYRDRAAAIQTFRFYVPLSKQESTMVMNRVGAMIYATVYGSLGVAAAQGLLGGLMFWMLGFPAPLLWGSVMMLFALIPVAGTAMIWLPAAIFLFVQGSTTKGLILLAYGATAISLIDNLLYPYLVGNNVRLHTVPVFLAIAGGLAVFGLSGLVVGPVVLSLTLALLEVLRKRTEDGRSAIEPVKSGV
jgi:predicted PurR-regulated permease PerM